MSTSYISENLFEHIPNETAKKACNDFTGFLNKHYELLEKVTLLAGLYLFSGGAVSACIAGVAIGVTLFSTLGPDNIKVILEPFSCLNDGDKGLILTATSIASLFLGNPTPASLGLAASFGHSIAFHITSNYR